MAFEQKPNMGSLWKNDRKENDRHPDLKGTLNVDGVLYEIGAWKNVTKDGKPWLKLEVKPPYKREDRSESGRDYRDTTPDRVDDF